MLGEKYMNKIFLLFLGSERESAEMCHRTKRSHCMNYRLKWPLQKTFFSLTPLLPGFPESLTPLLQEYPESHPSGWGGGGRGPEGWFFLEQPIWIKHDS